MILTLYDKCISIPKGVLFQVSLTFFTYQAQHGKLCYYNKNISKTLLSMRTAALSEHGHCYVGLFSSMTVN